MKKNVFRKKWIKKGNEHSGDINNRIFIIAMLDTVTNVENQAKYFFRDVFSYTKFKGTIRTRSTAKESVF